MITDNSTATKTAASDSWTFEFRADPSTWLIGFSWNTGREGSYWGAMKYFCFNFLCFSWMVYKW